MKKKTADQVLASLSGVSARDPLRVDSRVGQGVGGRYVYHGKPCCLVGEILADQGASTAVLKALDAEGETIDTSSHPFWRRFDADALALLTALQRWNDRGDAWGVIAWEALRIDPYWFRNNRKFAFPGPWCTEENGHISEWSDRPSFPEKEKK